MQADHVGRQLTIACRPKKCQRPRLTSPYHCVHVKGDAGKKRLMSADNFEYANIDAGSPYRQ